MFILKEHVFNDMDDLLKCKSKFNYFTSNDTYMAPFSKLYTLVSTVLNPLISSSTYIYTELETLVKNSDLFKYKTQSKFNAESLSRINTFKVNFIPKYWNLGQWQSSEEQFKTVPTKWGEVEAVRESGLVKADQRTLDDVKAARERIRHEHARSVQGQEDASGHSLWGGPGWRTPQRI